MSEWKELYYSYIIKQRNLLDLLLLNKGHVLVNGTAVSNTVNFVIERY